MLYIIKMIQSLNNKDLTNTTSDTTKVTISNGETIDDYKVYYKAATADVLQQELQDMLMEILY